MSSKLDHQPPIIYRFLIKFGRPFGLRWVGNNKAAVIYRLELYQSLKGPGFFWINPFTQTMRSVIDLAPDFLPVEASAIRTRDGLQTDLTVALAYTFEPAFMPQDKEKASVFANWKRDTHRAIITDNTRRALQAVVPTYNATQICRGEVFAKIEQEVMRELDTRLRGLALKPMLCMILLVGVPAALQDRFAAVVQRQVNIDDLRFYTPDELAQARLSELIEVMAKPGSIISVADATGVVTTPHGRSTRRVVDSGPEDRPTSYID